MQGAELNIVLKEKAKGGWMHKLIESKLKLNTKRQSEIIENFLLVDCDV